MVPAHRTTHKSGGRFTFRGVALATLAAAKKKKTSAPSLSSQVPAGFYDPSLDYQQGAATRGLQDLQADTSLGNTRLSDDYQLGLGQNTEDTTYGLGQLGTGNARTLADLATQRANQTTNYNLSLGSLQRKYTDLAGSQADAENAAGLSLGGAAAQSAAKRASNQAFERQPLDTGYQQQMAADDLGVSRANEDYASQVARENQLSGRAAGALGLNYQRATTDAGTKLTRATREGTFYDQGIGQQKTFQATQAGWTPPAPTPKKKAAKKK